MPVVAQRVLELSDRDDTEPAELQRVIHADPALASRILKVANSALFGQSRQIATLSQAVILIGYSAIRSLVMAAAIRSVFLPKASHDGVPGFGRASQLLWCHAVGTAIGAKYTASRLGYSDGEMAFLGGLLHDIGQPVLLSRSPETYCLIQREIQRDPKVVTETIERRHLGTDHLEVGGSLCKNWNLPAPLEDLCRLHHEGVASNHPTLLSLVQFADMLAVRLGLGPRVDPTLDLAALPVARLLGLHEGMVNELEQTVSKAYLEEARYFFEG